MERRTALVALLSLCLPLSLKAAGGPRATPDEAQALVKKAIDFYRKRGRDAAISEFSRADGTFFDRGLYVTVHQLDGVCLADINERIRGRNMLEERDLDGKYFTRERLDAAKSDASGWQEYKYFNPASHRMELKRTYWERFDNLVFAAGAYRSLVATM